MINELLIRPNEDLPVELRPLSSRLKSLLGSRERLETRLDVLEGAAGRVDEIGGELERLDCHLSRILSAMSRESEGLGLLCARAALDGFIEAGPELDHLVSLLKQVPSGDHESPGQGADLVGEPESVGIIGATFGAARRIVRSRGTAAKKREFEKAAREFERNLCENPWGDGRYSCPLTAGRLEAIADLSAEVSEVGKRISDLISARDSISAGLGWSSGEDPDWLGKAIESCRSDLAEVARQAEALEGEIVKAIESSGFPSSKTWQASQPRRDASPDKPDPGNAGAAGAGPTQANASCQDEGVRRPRGSRLDDPAFVEALPDRGCLMPDHYRFPREESCLSTAEMAMFSRDTIVAYYRNVTEKLSLPDRASMIRSSSTQVPVLHDTVARVSGLLGIPPPEVYLCFENDRYGAACEGLDRPWLVFFTENFDEMTNQEICFLTARELAHIHCGHLLYRIIADSLVEAAGNLDRVPGLSMALSLMGPFKTRQVLGMVLNPWRRASEHTADLAGFLATGGDIEACCRAIMKENLRTRKLMGLTSVAEYYSQIRLLDGMTGFMANLGKLDETRPYGQYRIREIIRYASSARGKKALRLVDSRERTESEKYSG